MTFDGDGEGAGTGAGGLGVCGDVVPSGRKHKLDTTKPQADPECTSAKTNCLQT